MNGSISKMILKDYVQDCRDCSGTGYYFIVPCHRCHNTGKEIKLTVTDILPQICEDAGVEMFKTKDRIDK